MWLMTAVVVVLRDLTPFTWAVCDISSIVCAPPRSVYASYAELYSQKLAKSSRIATARNHIDIGVALLCQPEVHGEGKQPGCQGFWVIGALPPCNATTQHRNHHSDRAKRRAIEHIESHYRQIRQEAKRIPRGRKTAFIDSDSEPPALCTTR